MKVLVCGAFDFVNLPCGGQPVKTRELYSSLIEQYGKGEVTYVDTYGWKKKPFSLLLKLLKYGKRAQNIIMLPAQNGVTVFSWIIILIKKLWRKRVFYDVIGGWLPNLLEGRHRLAAILKEFDGIWVETLSMKEALQATGFSNVVVIHNFKKLQSIGGIDDYTVSYPLKVCLFSRIQKEKGIEDAINAIEEINKKKGGLVYVLDIYGPIDSSYSARFELLRTVFAEEVFYKGIINPSQSVEVLRNYFALLFPTHYLTEGVPGSVIDAYASGLPVIAARWVNSSDVIDEGRTGLCYQFGCYEDFVRILDELSEKPEVLTAMRPFCLKKYQEFSPKHVVKLIDSFLQ